MVSIIVPAYNSEKYLEECVESIFSQSVSDWELLLVDDGSTDSTGSLCDSYGARDRRVRVIHRRNGGLSEARNTGLDQAKGDYISFLDADDVLHPRFLEATLGALHDTDADIAGTAFTPFSAKKPYIPCEVIPKEETMTGREAILRALYQRASRGSKKKLASSAWGKLYKAETWGETRFRSGTWYEDLDIFYRVWQRASKVAFIPAGLIGYRQHAGSFLHSFTLRRADVLDVTDRLLRYYQEEEKDNALQLAAETRRFAAHWNILLLLVSNRQRVESEEEAGAILRRCREVLRGSRRRVLTNREARLKDRVGAVLAYSLPLKTPKSNGEG